MFRMWVTVLALVGATTGCGNVAHIAQSQPTHSTHPSAPVAASPTPSAPSVSVSYPLLRPLEVGTTRVPAPASVTTHVAPNPSRLRIPAIGVDTSIMRLGLNPDGTVEVPPDSSRAGWFAKGVAPGEDGPAVILGHLDSATGPAIFYRLESLKSGDTVFVQREDGSEIRFAVRRSVTLSVDAFPSFDVYGATADPELRLITCGGQYSAARGRYLANVVVAVQTS